MAWVDVQDAQKPEGGFVVEFDARTLEQAHDAIEAIKANPPRGYRLYSSRTRRKGIRMEDRLNHSAGQKCFVSVTLQRVDSRVRRPTFQEIRFQVEPMAEKANARPAVAKGVKGEATEEDG